MQLPIINNKVVRHDASGAVLCAHECIIRHASELVYGRLGLKARELHKIMTQKSKLNFQI